MCRSGKLLGKNDNLIRELLKDPRYMVFKDGTIWTNRSVNGSGILPNNSWRRADREETGNGRKGYFCIKYKTKRLMAHRIVFQAFCGQLKNDLVVNHIDRNRSNNKPSNLEQVTQLTNVNKCVA